ncbi:MAG: sterol desaturase family protein [Proteobacteria bacterium]|nr:sterol desaturase family protein [Pseudomonadota bacterium]
MNQEGLDVAAAALALATVVVATHYLVSFSQTLFHRHLGHRRVGGWLFRNHVGWHHVYYAKDHMVSNSYLTERGNNTPYFLIPTAAAAAALWFLLPLDLFLAHVGTLVLSFAAHVYLDVQYHVAGSWLGRFGWFRRKQQLHFLHHRHANANFAVIDFFWDRLLGTFQGAPSDERWLGRDSVKHPEPERAA